MDSPASNSPVLDFLVNGGLLKVIVGVCIGLIVALWQRQERSIDELALRIKEIEDRQRSAILYAEGWRQRYAEKIELLEGRSARQAWGGEERER